ncbi:unnamed protein product, partial [Symbiodinium pilosum]
VAVEDEGSKGSSFGQGGLGATEMSQDLEFVRALWEDSIFPGRRLWPDAGGS